MAAPAPAPAQAGAPAPSNEFSAVIAVDLGTHGTSYAIAFPSGVTDLAQLAKDIIPRRPGSGSGVEKALSAVLVDKTTGRMIAMGEEARRCFAEALDSKAANLSYYSHFKMAIMPGEGRPRDILTAMVQAASVDPAADGGPLSGRLVVDLFADLLSFIRVEALDRLGKQTGATIAPERICWVLTVPAIWDDAAKTFMRHAALKAGLIDSLSASNIMLALEPECAMLAALADCAPPVRAKLQPGTRIMIVDAGGGTVDITVDEVVSVGPPPVPLNHAAAAAGGASTAGAMGAITVREVCPPSGGPWGGTYADAAFMDMVADIFGDRWKFVDERSQLDIRCSWEVSKMNDRAEDVPALPDESGSASSAPSSRDEMAPTSGVVVALLPAISAIQEHDESGYSAKLFKADVDRYAANAGLSGPDGLTAVGAGKLQLGPRALAYIFDPVVSQTIGHVRALLERGEAGPVTFIMLVGGFAESKRLQRTLMLNFQTPDRKVIVPNAPGRAVNVGAALFALSPAVISERISRWTYAKTCAVPFDAKAGHDATLAFEYGGAKYIRVVQPLVKKGQAIPVGMEVQDTCVPLTPDQPNMGILLYRTNAEVTDHPCPRGSLPTVPEPPGGRYVSGPGRHPSVPAADRVGELHIDVGAIGRPAPEREVLFTMAFGGTEITAGAHSKVTGEKRDYTFKWE